MKPKQPTARETVEAVLAGTKYANSAGAFVEGLDVVLAIRRARNNSELGAYGTKTEAEVAAAALASRAPHLRTLPNTVVDKIANAA